MNCSKHSSHKLLLKNIAIFEDIQINTVSHISVCLHNKLVILK